MRESAREKEREGRGASVGEGGKPSVRRRGKNRGEPGGATTLGCEQFPWCAQLLLIWMVTATGFLLFLRVQRTQAQEKLRMCA